MDRAGVAAELDCKAQRTTVWVKKGRPVSLVVHEELNPKVREGRITFGSKSTTREQADRVHGRIVEVYVHSTPQDYEHLGTFQITVDSSPAGVEQARMDAPDREAARQTFFGTLYLERID
jgi:hypothetical protein